ncbi:hypothetical protein ACFYTQ_28045 [Nocardia sp. NPDC004068]|uniref:hypothetical protein n=1 Tax=Nocardia sp. NPDC004068 TaxID=3364303 RepID=UPI003674C97E
MTGPLVPPPDSPGGGGCGVINIGGCVATAIDGFFQRLVDSGLDPMLGLLSHTLLTTPGPDDLPQTKALWSQSWELVVAVYGLLVMAAGVLLMLRETLQTQWSLRELAPRLVVGFVAGAMSMALATAAIGLANALAQAVAGDDGESDSAAAALRQLVGAGAHTGIFALLLMSALQVMLVVLLVTYVVRVVVTILLIVAAPLALMCHALPGADAVARWWWRSFAACLGIQVAQSLILVTVVRVFLTPGAWGFFGPTKTGMVDLVVALALMAVLIKTPFWLLSTLRIGNGRRTFIGSLARGYVAYKTFGLLKGGGAARTAARSASRARRTAAGPPDPYARVRATRDGQLMLPLEGVHRVRKPRRDPPPSPSAGAQPKPARPARGRQLAFDFSSTEPDPYRGIRPRRDGQYPLPIPVTRVSKPTSPPGPRPAARAPAVPRGRRPEQLAFDFDTPAPGGDDPYAGIRPRRDGQYPLPFPVTRVKPAPPPPPPPLPPARVRPVGRQLHLPLPDLPVRRRAPRAPRGGTLR